MNYPRDIDALAGEGTVDGDTVVGWLLRWRRLGIVALRSRLNEQLHMLGLPEFKYLFGQDQLVITGQTQPIFFASMGDIQLAPTL